MKLLFIEWDDMLNFNSRSMRYTARALCEAVRISVILFFARIAFKICKLLHKMQIYAYYLSRAQPFCILFACQNLR